VTGYACFKCGLEGHFAADCAYTAELGRPVWPAPVAPRAEGTPPSPAYLKERQRLGMASSGPDVLSADCPWCKAPRWRACVNTGTGAETDPHYARQAAAGVARPSLRLADLALSQVAESRAAPGPRG
jgi:Zinc knuckle